MINEMAHLTVDFILWGYLKAKVYTTPPRDIKDLQKRITDEVAELHEDHGMIRRAINAMRANAELCIQRDGGREY